MFCFALRNREISALTSWKVLVITRPPPDHPKGHTFFTTNGRITQQHANRLTRCQPAENQVDDAMHDFDAEVSIDI